MTSSTPAKLEVLADPQAVAQRVAQWLLEQARATDGFFAVSLSGGKTPRPIYECLAASPCRDSFPWERTHWFWGDERFVPHDDALSNCRMVREALLSRAPIPPANIHPIPTEGMSADAAAAAYERELKFFYGADRLDPDRPLFDVTILGLGADGHTASLFPHSPALKERERWVAAVAGAKPETRITLTYPALESSRSAAFVVVGNDKREIFARLRQGDQDIPAAQLHPVGTLHFFSDRSAAGT